MIRDGSKLYPKLQRFQSARELKLAESTGDVGNRILFVGSSGCQLCTNFIGAFEVLANKNPEEVESKSTIDIPFWHIIVSKVRDLEELGLSISSFPTVLGYVDSQIKCGWQGFFHALPSNACIGLAMSILNEYYTSLTFNTLDEQLKS